MQEPINNQSMLKVGTVLRGIYRIDSYLSSGGFGNTYVATNIEFDERVAVKEFFMRGITQRDGNQTTVSVSNMENQESFLQQREKFKKEARRLRQLNNPHIVRVHDLFEENGTAYYVMDYVDGENLSDRLKRTGRPMTESEVNLILPQILDALKSVHDADIWHLDLKPANIMLEKGGNIKLIDFGASKQLNAQKGGATTSTAISYTNGYAPREQMEQNYDKFGPWTDLYALGATLYNLLTNKRPPLPTDIDDDISEDKHLALPMLNVSDAMKQHILWLMKTNRLQRPKSVEDITNSYIGKNSSNNQEGVDIEDTIIISTKNTDNINANIEQIPLQNEKKEAQEINKEQSNSYRKRKLIWILISLVLVLIVGTIYIQNRPHYIDEYSKAHSIYRNSGSTNIEKDEAIEKFRELAEKEYGPALYMLGTLSIDSVESKRFFEKAMDVLPKEAKSGDIYAQCCLGEVLKMQGKFKEAFEWFLKSAKQGLAVAMIDVGDSYILGEGTEVDNSIALEWYEKAANAGDDNAQRNLAFIYESGMLDVVDSLKAYKWYEVSAKQGNGNAMARLGYYFRDGVIVNKSMQQAFKWFLKSADNNDAEGCFNVALFYRFGREPFEIVDKNVNEAINYFKKALECENASAFPEIHAWLAYCYFDTGEKDKMFEHFSIAANDGIAEAQYQLAICYQQGIGTKKDSSTARYWFKKAKENGYEE